MSGAGPRAGDRRPRRPRAGRGALRDPHRQAALQRQGLALHRPGPPHRAAAGTADRAGPLPGHPAPVAGQGPGRALPHRRRVDRRPRPPGAERPGSHPDPSAGDAAGLAASEQPAAGRTRACRPPTSAACNQCRSSCRRSRPAPAARRSASAVASGETAIAPAASVAAGEAACRRQPHAVDRRRRGRRAPGDRRRRLVAAGLGRRAERCRSSAAGTDAGGQAAAADPGGRCRTGRRRASAADARQEDAVPARPDQTRRGHLRRGWRPARAGAVPAFSVLYVRPQAGRRQPGCASAPPATARATAGCRPAR